MASGIGRASTLAEALALLVETDGQQLHAVLDAKDFRIELTRRELGTLAATYAAGLVEAGVGRGDRVVIAHPTSMEFLGAFWGSQVLGAVAVPAAPASEGRAGSAEAQRLATIVRRAEPAAVVGPPEVRHHLRDADLRFVDPLAGARWDDVDEAPVAPDDPAIIQFTSGSTREPLGCVLTHAAVVANVSVMEERLGIRGPTVGWNWCPPYHDMGLMGAVVLPVWSGWVEILLQPTEEFVVNPLSWLKRMAERRGEMTSAPNFAFALVNRRLRRGVPDIDLSHVRCILNGAEPISPPVVAEFLTHLEPTGLRPDVMHPGYGLAEHVVFATSSPGGLRTRSFDRADLSSAGTGSIEVANLGRPLPGVQLRVVDPTGEPVGPETLGEVELRSAMVMTGYHGAPEATARRFRDGWLRTGDIGLVDEAGELFLVGRADDVLILNGRNFYAYDIEQAVTSVAGTRTGGAAAFTVPGDEGDRLVVVVEARARDRRGFAGEVRTACHERTGAVPAEVAVARPGSLPHTSSGKLRRNEVKRRYRDGAYTAPPGTEAEPGVEAGPGVAAEPGVGVGPEVEAGPGVEVGPGIEAGPGVAVGEAVR